MDILSTESVDMWRMTKEDSQFSPSVEAGMNYEEELVWRMRGVCFIQIAGSRLELPLQVVGTASALFHRFYSVVSLYDYPYDKIAATCLFVACKSEETARRALDIAKIWSFENEESYYEEDVSEFADDILHYELTVVDTTRFDLDMDHPYYYLHDFCEQVEVSDEVLNTCVAMMNDSYRLPFSQWYGNKLMAAVLLMMSFCGCEVEYEIDPDSELGRIIEEYSHLIPGK
ncbi:hypothetical protein G6F46_000541 [Rhizopus delemar]|nr:hypothetical protein G6F43_000046 [Rhizopus delemar]KAG1548800.1 hypothetical protein G6F51_003446 [Rhizopus arrhizus]KAG1457500.1 hypothetical protein G6F55_005898 [Rhizopus delemar]KAG1510107.1 hypothetical protein G6F53_006931 [Rhizopus delemar]KAG1521123.1 hypothetical protein G6F52_007026 [Rhizopus delemar]